ncbi:MAG: acyl carrier protein [Anaerolineales bacterium]|nr:acyl carrier protein [Anaerolineales bacterium]
MKNEEIETIVLEIVAKVAKRDVQELSLENRIAEDLGMKSVSRLELAALLEDSFPVQIDNFEIRKPKSIAELVDLVKTKM